MPSRPRANANVAIPQRGNSILFGGATEIYQEYTYQQLRGGLAQVAGPDWWGVWDDFRGAASAALGRPWRTNLASGATIAVSSSQTDEGVADFVTDSDDDDHATLAYALVHLVSNGWGFMEARINNVSAITLRAFEVGWSDALSETNGLAFSSHDATPVDVATDAAVFGYNTDESTTNFSLLSVNDGTPAYADSGVAVPAAGTFTKLAIAIGPAGQALYYINGTLIERRPSAVATTAVLTPWITLKSLSGAAKTFQVDYVLAYGPSGLSR